MGEAPDCGKWAGRPRAQELANVTRRMCDISIRIGRDPDWGKWAGRPWGQELANIIHVKRMCDISIRIGPQIGANGLGGPGPRIGKCHKENV